MGLGGRKLGLRTLRGRRILAAVVLITGLASVVARNVMVPDHGHAVEAPGVGLSG